MEYYEITFKTTPTSETINDVLCALAGEAGCESFIPNNEGLTAYAQQKLFDEDMLKSYLEFFPIENVTVEYSIKEAENKDWNQEWEENSFQPIIIGNECVVHGSNHTDVPIAKYNIKINPRLAFGSGHHQTTGMMMKRLLSDDIQQKKVLDMGCGTCILGILALMRGAESLVAIDIDEWSVENSIENLKLNNIQHNAEVLLGDATLLNDMHFDLILANINRNILLADMERYVKCLNANGTLYMSGFYTEDIPLIKGKGEELGLTFIDKLEDDNWACVKLKK